MKKITLLISLIMLLTVTLTAQTITITGQYLDKISNPLDNATVEYLFEGNQKIGEAITGADGLFAMQVEITGIEKYTDIFKSACSPNPFNSYTQFTIEVNTPGTVSIVSSDGKFVDGLKIK